MCLVRSTVAISFAPTVKLLNSERGLSTLVPAATKIYQAYISLPSDTLRQSPLRLIADTPSKKKTQFELLTSILTGPSQIPQPKDHQLLNHNRAFQMTLLWLPLSVA